MTTYNEQLFSVLPSDILIGIFSHLNKSECLICMSVCRLWHNVIPQYCKSQWTELKFYRNKLSMMHTKGWLKCIGDHVRCVIFEAFHKQRDILDVANMLIDHQCHSIEYLGTQLKIKTCLTIHSFKQNLNFVECRIKMRCCDC